MRKARSSWSRHPVRRSSSDSLPLRTEPPLPPLPPLPPIVASDLIDLVNEPVRLVAPTVESPFAPGREVALARVEGSLLENFGVRDGDHVALVRRDTAEHGDLAAVVGDDGRTALWKVYPEGESLRLSSGDLIYRLRTGPRPRVHGVVVAVLRRFAQNRDAALAGRPATRGGGCASGAGGD